MIASTWPPILADQLERTPDNKVGALWDALMTAVHNDWGKANTIWQEACSIWDARHAPVLLNVSVENDRVVIDGSLPYTYVPHLEKLRHEYFPLTMAQALSVTLRIGVLYMKPADGQHAGSDNTTIGNDVIARIVEEVRREG